MIMTDFDLTGLIKREEAKPTEKTSADLDVQQQTEDFLDKMVAEASIPNLVTLLKQGIEAGLVSPQPKYK